MSAITEEAFLTPFSAACGRTEPPAEVRPFDTAGGPHGDGACADRTVDELAQRFILEAKAAGIEAVRASAGDAGRAAAALARRMGAGSVVHADDPAADELGLPAALADEGLDATRWDAANAERSVSAAEKAAVGISFPFAGIAESATAVQACDERCGRSVCLLPEAYIAVIRESALVPHMMQAMERAAQLFGEALPSHILFSTGPSATSDIELVHVVGVHGPLSCGVVLVRG